MRKAVWIFIIFLSLGLSSCIDLLDEITLNDDKSGSVFIGFKSQLLGSIMGAAKEQLQTSAMVSFEEFPNNSKAKLIKIKGISEVKSFDQISEGRFGIGFNFANAKALNKAYYALFDMEKTWYSPNIIKIGKHKISRRNLTPQLIKELEENNPEIKNSEYLKYFNLQSVVILPSEPTMVKHGEKEQLPNGKKIIMNYSFSKVLVQEYSTSYKITY